MKQIPEPARYLCRNDWMIFSPYKDIRSNQTVYERKLQLFSLASQIEFD